jgi:hypothetical protein
MVKDDHLDLESEGRLADGNGYQYKLHLAGGRVDYLRDVDPIANLVARLETAKAETPNKMFWFSGARGKEEQLILGDDGEPKIGKDGEPESEDVDGPVRGKGCHEAHKIEGLSYSADGEPAPVTQEAAFAAAKALLDAQIGALLGKKAEMQAQADGQGERAAEPDASAHLR